MTSPQAVSDPAVANATHESPLSHDHVVTAAQNEDPNSEPTNTGQATDPLPDAAVPLMSEYHNPYADADMLVSIGMPMNIGMPNYAGQMPPNDFDIGNVDMGNYGMGSMPGMGNLFGHPYLADGLSNSGLMPEPIARDSFAMMKFPDMQYFVKTNSIVIGRDELAYKHLIRERDALSQGYQVGGSGTRVPRTPLGRNRGNRYQRSIVSDRGGMLTIIADDSDGRKRKSRKASRQSKSRRSTAQRGSRGSSLERSVNDNTWGLTEPAHKDEAPHILPEDEEAAPVDLHPSPDNCARVNIHPPTNPNDLSATIKNYKAISRKHLEITYNPSKDTWEAIGHGRNGFYVDDTFYKHTEIVDLGDKNHMLQVGAIHFSWTLPEHDRDDATSTVGDFSDRDKEINFEFGEPLDDNAMRDTSDEEAEYLAQQRNEQSDDSGDSGDSEDDGSVTGNVKSKKATSEAAMSGDEDEDCDGDDHDMGEQGVDDGKQIKPQKKRGPGRPPKNGVMSRREEKAKRDKDKKAAEGKSSSDKNKAGRPQKDSQENTPPANKEKRKYTKRKPKDPDSTIVQEGGSGGEKKPSKEKKEKKSAKQARSPSPDFKEEDFPESEKLKPQVTYVAMIHEALSNAKAPSLSLGQIYRAIERRYPYFKLRCATTGWQSSVRHNLSQHDAFTKHEKDGKGFTWAIVPGVSIEKEKKQRHVSPPAPGPYYHPGGPHPMHGPPYGQGMMGPPGPYQPHHYGQGSAPNSYPYPHGPPPPHSGHPGQYAGQQIVPNSGGSYSSPYGAPKPQGPPPQQQAINQRPSNGGPPPFPQNAQHAQQPRLPTPQQSHNPISEVAMNTINVFKKQIASAMPATEKPDVIMESAWNRILGKSNAPIFPNPHEDKIMEALKNLLAKVQPGWTSSTLPQPPLHNRQPVTRPSLMGPSRQNSVPRPPVMAPLGPPRTNPGSPANMPSQTQPVTAASSPATVSPTPPVSTPVPSPNLGSSALNPPLMKGSGVSPVATNSAPVHIKYEPTPMANPIRTQDSPLKQYPAQLAGSKRPCDDPEDRSDYKRANGPLSPKADLGIKFKLPSASPRDEGTSQRGQESTPTAGLQSPAGDAQVQGGYINESVPHKP